MRGEYQRIVFWFTFLVGSSPHARGILSVSSHPAVLGQVHPRMRGEYSTTKQTRATMIGSSPHARGILFLRKIRRLPYRFIPACAGNTAKCRKKGKVLKVHPRMRGEYLRILRRLECSKGSSPHARGILLVTNAPCK